MSDRVEMYQLRLLDVAREGNYQLWGALLATEGTMVALFSIAGAVMEEGSLGGTIVAVLGMVAMAFLVANIKSVRDRSQWMGEQSLEGLGSRSGEEKKGDIDRAKRLRKNNRWRERTVYVILVAQAAVVGWLLVLK